MSLCSSSIRALLFGSFEQARERVWILFCRLAGTKLFFRPTADPDLDANENKFSFVQSMVQSQTVNAFSGQFWGCLSLKWICKAK